MELLASGSGILFAVLGLGFVIFIHELGHFLFAKWAGVRVDTFSIGFGPIIWSKSIGETEYAMSLLPLGGYVAMREKADGSGRSMEEVHPAWRALILLAGVVFNAVSSFLILLCLAWYGMPMFPPMVGSVAPEMVDHRQEVVATPAARLGLRSGDRIISYNGVEPRGFEDVIAISMDQPRAPVQLVIERDGERIELPQPGQEPVRPVASKVQGRASLGFGPAMSRRITLASGGPAAELDLAGWSVVGIDGEDVSGLIGEELSQRLVLAVGREVTLDLERDGERRQVSLRYAGSSASAVGAAALGFPVVVQNLVEGLPAARAGVAVGDVLAAVNDQPVLSNEHFIGLVRRQGDEPFTLSWLHRDEAGVWVERSATLGTEVQATTGQRLIGVAMDHRRSGILPYLPPAMGSEENPLAAAGIDPGDAVVGISPLPETSAITVHSLRGGEAIDLQIPHAAYSALIRPYDPPLLMKFIGAKPRASIVSRLIGTRVLEIGGPGPSANQLRVEDPRLDPAERFQVIDLTTVPEAPRAQLLEGLAVGDWIMDVSPQAGAEGGLTFNLLRGAPADGLRSVEVEPAGTGVALGFHQPYQPPYQLQAWTEAFGLAADESLKILTLTFKIIPKFFRDAEEGGVDASKSLAGPIGIFSELKARAELGFASFLKLLALLGLNLVIVNLLPIPIADGGRLLMLGVEVVIRRPVPERIERVVNTAGFVLILALMVFVIGVDVLREMGRH